MGSGDNLPLANSPVAQLIAQRQNNRFGAALSSLYSFCKAREEAVRQGAATGARRDAYSVILFNEQATVRFVSSSPQSVLFIHSSGALEERFHQLSRASHKSLLEQGGWWYKLQCSSEVCTKRDGEQLEHRKVIPSLDN
jgi:hypothetical protein